MIKELATGLGVTLENLFRKPYTVKYPEEKLEMFSSLPVVDPRVDPTERPFLLVEGEPTEKSSP